MAEEKEKPDQQEQDQQRQQEQMPGPVPYERFKEINDTLKATQAQLAEIKEAQKRVNDEKLVEQQKWQELAEKRGIELEVERTIRLRLEVAARKGISPELADRIKGNTVEQMEADADALLEFLKPKEGPGIPPVKQGTKAQTLDIETMTPEEIRKNKEKLWAEMK